MATMLPFYVGHPPMSPSRQPVRRRDRNDRSTRLLRQAAGLGMSQPMQTSRGLNLGNGPIDIDETPMLPGAIDQNAQGMRPTREYFNAPGGGGAIGFMRDAGREVGAEVGAAARQVGQGVQRFAVGVPDPSAAPPPRVASAPTVTPPTAAAGPVAATVPQPAANTGPQLSVGQPGYAGGYLRPGGVEGETPFASRPTNAMPMRGPSLNSYATKRLDTRDQAGVEAGRMAAADRLGETNSMARIGFMRPDQRQDMRRGTELDALAARERARFVEGPVGVAREQGQLGRAGRFKQQWVLDDPNEPEGPGHFEAFDSATGQMQPVAMVDQEAAQDVEAALSGVGRWVSERDRQSLRQAFRRRGGVGQVAALGTLDDEIAKAKALATRRGAQWTPEIEAELRRRYQAQQP